MKILTRSYWPPVVAALLMVAATGVWTWQTFQRFREAERENSRRFASGVFNALQGTFRAVGDHGRFQKDQLEQALGETIRHSPLSFVVVEQDGRRMCAAGQVPDVLNLAAETGEEQRDGMTILWRRVRLQDELRPPRPERMHSMPMRNLLPPRGDFHPTPAPSPDAKYDLIFGPGDQVMALGLAHVPPPPGRRGFASPLRDLTLILVATLLFIGASTTAWILSIRSGRLTEQLEVERMRRNHLEELGLAAAGLAHETKNPLGIILGLAQRIASDPRVPEESRTMADHILDEVDKAAARVGGFMVFAKQREARKTPVDVREAVAKVVEVISSDAQAAKVAISQECPPLTVLADGEMLSQILVNLLLNSLHASRAGGAIAVRVENLGKSARLVVADRGSGITADLLPNVFKPYVTGRADGHGLGLAIVKRYADLHGWTVGIESQPGRGTTVTITGIQTLRSGNA